PSDKVADDSSERNVVFHVVELARRLLGGGAFGRRARLRGPGRGGIVARPATAFPAPEHLHGVGADLGGVAVLPVLVLPLAGAQASLDIDLRALLQVLARHLRQPAEE